MTPKDEALRILAANCPAPKAIEIVPLRAALGRVLAEDQKSDIDMPPFHRSAMDGFAVRSVDLAKLPVELTPIETVKAGDWPQKPLTPGTATRIMTGAPCPEGANAVVMIETTEALPNGNVRFSKPVAVGQNISRRGEDMTLGETVLFRGTSIRAAEVGILAALGIARVPVFGRPRVAIIATGDELIEPGTGVPMGGQIRESNGYMLEAQTASLGLGIDVEYLGIARDTRESVADFVDRAVARDVVILSGGVSMGDFDFVHVELKSRGLSVLLERVAIKPGKPLLFGKLAMPDGREVVVFGLPGNPMSSFVTFELFVRPFLRGMIGRMPPHTLTATARLTAPIAAKPMPRAQHIPARIGFAGDRLVATSVPWHGSGDLRGMIDANGFVVLPTNEGPPPVGSPIEVVLLEPDCFRIAGQRSRRETDDGVAER